MPLIVGQRELAVPSDAVMAKLGNAQFVVSCLNRVDQLLAASPHQAQWKTKIGFGLLSSTADITLTILERADNFIRYHTQVKTSGGKGLSETVLRFVGHNPTMVHYEANILERTGMLKLVGESIIIATAKTLIDETWQNVETKLRSEC